MAQNCRAAGYFSKNISSCKPAAVSQLTNVLLHNGQKTHSVSVATLRQDAAGLGEFGSSDVEEGGGRHQG